MAWLSFLLLVFLLSRIFFVAADNSPRWDPRRNIEEYALFPPVQLHRLDQNQVVLENGIVNVTLSVPEGIINGIEYNAIDNLLETSGKMRGYWDVDWHKPQEDRNDDIFDIIQGTSFNIVVETESQVELSFSRSWNPSLANDLPLNTDKRFVMLRGSPGLYSYAIYEHLQGWPDIDIAETRIAFKLRKDLFHYMAISDTRHRFMPTAEERARGQRLDYDEAVRLPKDLPNKLLGGEVDDKYQYSADIKDIRVHGWICSEPRVGFWVITPSDEFRVGGPLKQELTSHTGPTSLAMFFSNHYSDKDLNLELRNGEAWKKVFGPVFIYLNSGSPQDDFRSLWEDAKEQMRVETGSWPYNFPQSIDYPHGDGRGGVTGRFLVNDRYINEGLMIAAAAYIGLAPVGETGSWQRDFKGYQFWTQSDADGYFEITGVRPGSYNLFGWVPGFMGDYKYEFPVYVLPGGELELWDLVFEPPRNGPTLWEIGIPDRMAAEFFVPDPCLYFVNNLYMHIDKFRQYGLWDRYTDYNPTSDIVYKVDVSDYRRDWFFAHVNRNKGGGIYEPTTWRIEFNLPNVPSEGNYTLWIALATSQYAKLKIGINKDPNLSLPDFETERMGSDNSIARHSNHGTYWLQNFVVQNSLLREGDNIIFLQQASAESKFCGTMYDYIRLEGPPSK